MRKSIFKYNVDIVFQRIYIRKQIPVKKNVRKKIQRRYLLGCPCSDSSSSSGSGSAATGSDSDKSEKSDAPAQSDSLQGKSPNHSTEPKRRHKSESSREWDENPDIYGIRRSGRSRKEPERLAAPRETQQTDERKKFKKRR